MIANTVVLHIRKEGALLTTKHVISVETRDILLVSVIPKLLKEIQKEQASDNN